MREAASKRASSRKTDTEQDPMKTTTGFRLVPAEPTTFEVDLAETEVDRGGMIIRGGEVLDGILEELENDLLSVDMGHAATEGLIDALRMRIVGSKNNHQDPPGDSHREGPQRLPPQAPRGRLLGLRQDSEVDTLRGHTRRHYDSRCEWDGEDHHLRQDSPQAEGGRILGGHGGGTFRAGAIDQLASHAERIGVRCITSQRGGDSTAVARDAVESARAKGDDVVIIDTAGRMQNKTNLMEELRKVHRVTKPHLVLFVADALAGNDAVEQAIFQSMLRFDGAV